jgi:hypothetical protein
MTPTQASVRMFWDPIDILVTIKVATIVTSQDGRYVFLVGGKYQHENVAADVPSAVISRDFGNTFSPYPISHNITLCSYTNEYYPMEKPVAAMDDSGQFIYVVGYNGLCMSNDYGDTFTFHSTNFIPVNIVTDKTGKYIVTVPNWEGSGLRLSEDYGKTWRIELSGMSVTGVSMSGNGKVILEQQQSLISKDYGHTWNSLHGCGSANSYGINENGTHIIGTCSRGTDYSAFHSFDYGVTWPKNESIPFPFSSILCDRTCDKVFASSSGNDLMFVNHSWIELSSRYETTVNFNENYPYQTLAFTDSTAKNVYRSGFGDNLIYRSFFSESVEAPTFSPTRKPTSAPTSPPTQVVEKVAPFYESKWFKEILIPIIAFIVPVIVGYFVRNKIAFRILNNFGFEYRILYSDDRSLIRLKSKEFGICLNDTESLCIRNEQDIIHVIKIDNGINQGLPQGLYDHLMDEVKVTFGIRSGRQVSFEFSEFERILLRQYLIDQKIVKPITFCLVITTYRELGYIKGFLFSLCLEKYGDEYLEFCKQGYLSKVVDAIEDDHHPNVDEEQGHSKDIEIIEKNKKEEVDDVGEINVHHQTISSSAMIEDPKGPINSTVIIHDNQVANNNSNHSNHSTIVITESIENI